MQYDLVFEGGGAKGMVFVGAMEEFSRRGHTPGRLLGTSAGAITAALLAAGYTSEEMLAALNERDDAGNPVFAAFMGAPSAFSPEEIDASVMIGFMNGVDIPLLPERAERIGRWVADFLLKNQTYCHLFSFVEKGGWFVADSFVEWLEAKLDVKQVGFSEIRMGEFFATTQKELTLIAADTADSRMLILNHNTAPDLPVKMAVRMSMSIPFLWQEVVWDGDWGTYNIGGRSIDLTGHTIVDGGLLSNFPIELFVSKDPQVLNVMGHNASPGVMGMLIDEMLAVGPAAAMKPKKDGVMSLKTAQRVMNLVNTMTGAHDKMVMEEFADLVVRLPAGGYGTTEFDMSDERREALVQAGRDHMSSYFNQQGPGTLAGPGTLSPKTRDMATRRAIDIFNR